MTHSPTPDVVLLSPAARLSARRRENTAPHVPRWEPQRPSAGRNTRRITLAVILCALISAGLLRSPRRRPEPAIHALVAADEARFAELCLRITRTRQRGIQQ